MYYDAANPQQTVLQPGVNTKWMLIDLVCGVAACVIGGAFLRFLRL